MRFAPFALAIALLVSAPAWAQDITGSARVIDGDTIDISGQRIRIHGIDAPESKQWCRIGMAEIECGKEATRAMRSHIAGNPVNCQERDVDRYRRVVAVCFNAEGRDVGAELVREGWALAYRRFSLEYVAEEREAKASK
ncbi:MAG: thermonuclease family protein, partial [Alphaproteobacteria bacterium]